MSSTWVCRATGTPGGMVADAEEVRKALRLFADPEGNCQLVSLPMIHTVSLPGRDLDGLARAVENMPGGAGVYFEVNPVREGLRTKAKAVDICRRRWLFLDIDPIKAEGFEKQSATDDEKNAALAPTMVVYNHLVACGWPEPAVIDSGNGWYLLYRIDLPNDEGSRALVRGVLYALAKLVEGQACSFDKSVHNADRLAKVPGTWAKKGQPSDDRPHRPCRIVNLPSSMEIVTEALLRAVVPEEPGSPPAAKPIREPFRVRAGTTGTRAYALAALEGERTKLALTSPGDRDNQLYRSGAALGELVGPDLLHESEVLESLMQAARDNRLLEDIGEEKVRDKLARSIAKGKSNPRVIPERNGHDKSVTAWAVPVEPSKKNDGPTIYTVPELLALDLPSPRWAIPGLLSEGLSILAGKPKLGKSWMALNLALTIACGGMALGSIQVQAGDVLYLALEDRLRRIRDRAAKVMGGLKIKPPNRLSVAVEWKRQDKGGVHDLAKWLGEAADPRLVVIDVWAKFRSPAKSKGSAYEQDYDQLTEVKSMADHYGASVLALHHTRKSAAEDVFDEISGTLGIAGAADGAMVLARARGKNEGTLAMTGRDIEEQTLSVEFDPDTFTWRSLGSAEDRLTGELQKKVLDYLKLLNGRSTFAADIAEHLKEDVNKVRTTLHRLFDKRIVRHVGSSWSYPGEGAEEEIPA